MELKEQIEIMTHYLNGGEVEYLVKEDEYCSWMKCVNPLWDWFEFDYRIKEQKQKITIEKWLCRVSQEDYVIVESSNIDKHKVYEKVKLLETYEVEL